MRRWWTLTCDRELYEWKCEAPRLNREIDVDVSVSGVNRRVVVGVHPDVAIDQARTVVGLAFSDFYETTDSPASCGAPGKTDDQGWHDMQRQYALTTEEIDLQASVESVGSELSVWLFAGSGPTLTYREEPGAAAGYSLTCWGQWVIVT